MKDILFALLTFGVLFVCFALVQFLIEAKQTLREVGRAAFRAASLMEKTEHQIDKTDSVVTSVAETVNLYDQVAKMPANWILGLGAYLKSVLSR